MTGRDFNFRGSLPPSKSQWIRALVLKSYEPRLLISHSAVTSVCDDVRYTQNALEALLSEERVNVGASAAAFRFLVMRASRTQGLHRIGADEALLVRPHEPMVQILNQLGVSIDKERGEWIIKSSGWRTGLEILTCKSDFSSQFASAVFLNSIDLEHDLTIEVDPAMPSRPYFEMTLSLLKECGISWAKEGNQFHIPKGQRLKPAKVKVESDLSSAFVLAVYGLLFGESTLSGLCFESPQSDRVFLRILKDMGADVLERDSVTGRTFIFRKGSLKSIEVCLSDSPDLFPVLAVLCSMVPGTSILKGIRNLIFKESNRIEKISELFSHLGVDYRLLSDSMEVVGSEKFLEQFTHKKGRISFDPANDHRIAMAASLYQKAGLPIDIGNPECVRKSFPNFWECVS